MARTSWGAELTYSWELESEDLKILEFFRPPTVPFDGSRWHPSAKSWSDAQRWKQLVTDRATTEYFLKVLKPQWYDRGGKVSWNDFVMGDGPKGSYPWIDPSIEQEVKSSVWEIKQSVKHLAYSAGELLQRMRALDGIFQGVKNWQCHIVFDRPPHGGSIENKKTNAKLISLVGALNDYAALKRYSQGGIKESYAKYIGPMKNSQFKGLQKELEKDDPELEKTDKQGHRAGPYKFQYVALRQNYGSAQKLGIEVRGGWEMSEFEDVVTRVTGVLANLSTSDFSAGGSREADAKQWSLSDYVAWAKKYRAGADAIPQKYRKLVLQAADRQVQKRTTFKDKDGTVKPKPKPEAVPWAPAGSSSPGVLADRWGMAFVAWEKHPAIPDSSGQSIVGARRKLEDSLDKLSRRAGLFAKDRKLNEDETSAQQVQDAFDAWFTSTGDRIVRYL